MLYVLYLAILLISLGLTVIWGQMFILSMINIILHIFKKLLTSKTLSIITKINKAKRGIKLIYYKICIVKLKKYFSKTKYFFSWNIGCRCLITTLILCLLEYRSHRAIDHQSGPSIECYQVENLLLTFLLLNKRNYIYIKKMLYCLSHDKQM